MPDKFLNILNSIKKDLDFHYDRALQANADGDSYKLIFNYGLFMAEFGFFIELDHAGIIAESAMPQLSRMHDVLNKVIEVNGIILV